MLKPSQYKGLNMPSQMGFDLFVAILDNRHSITVDKLRILVQVSRHNKIEDRPEFCQPILYRCSRQSYGVLRLNALDALRTQRIGIFYMLRLVDNTVLERNISVVIQISF